MSTTHTITGAIVGVGAAQSVSAVRWGVAGNIALGLDPDHPLLARYLGTTDPVPIWVIAACYITIALGTAFGGWRIVKTMGQRITKLKPVGGCCAETGGAIMLFVATGFGIPVSTTHTITGAIVGVGAAQSASAVRWGVAGNILWAWILTIPCSAFIAGAAWYAGRMLLSPS